MPMLIQQVVCHGCKETVSSFYVLSGRCINCGHYFSQLSQPNFSAGLDQLKKDKNKFIKDTMSKKDVKKLMEIDDTQLAKIHGVTKFGETRYFKSDLISAVHNGL